MTKFELLKFPLIAGITILLSGCASWGGVVEDTPRNQAETGGGVDGPDDTVFSKGGLLSGVLKGNNSNAANGLPVNKHLWRASINVLGASLPITSTDPFSGVIATDWGAAANAPNERVRVTATVQGTELTARGLGVSVFRETLNPAGAWISAPVNPQTASKLKDSILLRARELRIQETDGTVL